MSPQERAHHRRLAVVRAMGQPERFLAALLGELPDEHLATLLQADERKVWLLRLAGWPTRHRWAEDIDGLARLIDGDPLRVDILLRALGADAPG
jgi:hypothetical protein